MCVCDCVCVPLMFAFAKHTVETGFVDIAPIVFPLAHCEGKSVSPGRSVCASVTLILFCLLKKNFEGCIIQ